MILGRGEQKTAAETAPLAGGRRREALLRSQSDQARAQRLTAADVATLQGDPSPDGRAKVAAKFGRQFEELATSPQRDLALAVLQLLVRDVAKEVRLTLAETVAASPGLPRAAAMRLAGDDIDIARPVLERSPVLTDEDLVQVVRTNTMQYALAVAGRERLSEAVADALVDTRQEQVVARVLDNTGAELSTRAMERVLEDHGSDKAIEARLIRRPELPHELVERLVGAIGDRLEWQLTRDRQIPAEQARAIMCAVRERASIGLTAREHGDRKLTQHLGERLAAGDLSHDDLLRRLREGDVAGLEIGLALHARLDATRTRRLLYHPDRRHMVALCVTAGFSTPHYVTLRMAIDLAEAALAPSGKAPTYNAETIRYLQVQYERLGRDEVKLRELIGG